ncbi:hypothetical protein BC827DRAFT_1156193 [Russula dissimulans]|nr:hypothetical protein BC827DRAFT_1156193 [Russula dissimulans]
MTPKLVPQLERQGDTRETHTNPKRTTLAAPGGVPPKIKTISWRASVALAHFAVAQATLLAHKPRGEEHRIDVTHGVLYPKAHRNPKKKYICRAVKGCFVNDDILGWDTSQAGGSSQSLTQAREYGKRPMITYELGKGTAPRARGNHRIG